MGPENSISSVGSFSTGGVSNNWFSDRPEDHEVKKKNLDIGNFLNGSKVAPNALQGFSYMT